MRITLKWDGDRVRFTTVNSMGPNWRERSNLNKGTRLGTPLITAFSSQLEGEFQSGPVEADQTFVLTIAFLPSKPALEQAAAPA